MATSKKGQLKDYIENVAHIRPSAEVKFGSVQEDGSVDEISATEEYLEIITSDEVKEVADAIIESTNKREPTAGDLLEKIDKLAEERPEPEVITEEAEEVEEPEQLTEMKPVAPEEMVADPEQLGPVSGHYEEMEDEREERTDVSPDVSLILATLEKLIDKIDNMQNFTPVIHVPAPVIHVTLPETRRTVTKAIERDGEGYIKTVKEHIEDVPEGEPLIEVVKEEKVEEKPKPKRRQRKKKDEE